MNRKSLDLGVFSSRGDTGQGAPIEPPARPDSGRAPGPDPWTVSREPGPADPPSQFTIRGPESKIARFRRLCEDDRRTYIAMLEILMDAYEGGAGR